MNEKEAKLKYQEAMNHNKTQPCDEDVKYDPVNHPKHYTQHPSGVECIDITRHMNFNIGNAVKYLWRAGAKDNAPTIQDLEKAIWYINDEIKRIQRDIDTIHTAYIGTQKDYR